MLISFSLANYLWTKTVPFTAHPRALIFGHTEHLQVVIVKIKGESNCRTSTQGMPLGRHLLCVQHFPPPACHLHGRQMALTGQASPGMPVPSCPSSCMLDARELLKLFPRGQRDFGPAAFSNHLGRPEADEPVEHRSGPNQLS